MPTPPRLRCAALAPLLFAAATAAHTAEPLEEIDRLARDWVSLRTETARLETAWQTEQTLLGSTIAALQERSAALEEKRDLLRAQTAREREEIDTLRARNKSAVADLAAGEARLRVLTQRLLALRPSLPPRLSDALEMAFRSLANPALPASERLQLVMTALNRCAQFNRQITVGDEVLAVEGERLPKALDVIYWGLSHGYAIDRGTRQAWLGRPDGHTWRWAKHPEAFAAAAQLIAIAHDKGDPALVSVPAQITRALPAPVPSAP